MIAPCLGRDRGTQMTTRASPLACSSTASISAWPPIVSLATTRIVLMATRYSCAGGPAPTAAVGTGGFLNTPCTAPGTPYSYGPPTTVGRLSKLKIGGGEDTCHSSVSARHGLAVARGPPRQEATML